MTTLRDIEEHLRKEFKPFDHVLGVNSAGGVEFSFYDVLYAYYGPAVIIVSKERAEILFSCHIQDNKHLIKQIEKYSSLVDELGDFNNWQILQNTQSFNYSTTGADNSSLIMNDGDIRNVDTLTNSVAASDSNSLDRSKKLVKELDKTALPANQLTHSLTKDDLNTKQKTTNAAKSRTKSEGVGLSGVKFTSSNASEDYRDYLRLELPQLRNKFIKSFRKFFKCHIS